MRILLDTDCRQLGRLTKDADPVGRDGIESGEYEDIAKSDVMNDYKLLWDFLDELAKEAENILPGSYIKKVGSPPYRTGQVQWYIPYMVSRPWGSSIAEQILRLDFYVEDAELQNVKPSGSIADCWRSNLDISAPKQFGVARGMYYVSPVRKDELPDLMERVGRQVRRWLRETPQRSPDGVS